MDFLYFFIFAMVLGFAHSKWAEGSCRTARVFTDGHNARRRLLAENRVPGQPAAAKMHYMIWDDELAAKATAWAATFPTGHNPDKTIGSRRFSTGENIFWMSTTDLSYTLDEEKALDSWFNEHRQYKYGPLDAKNFSGIGHYTQMAWSNSVYVGCGVSHKIELGFKKYYVVCNYGPPGNFLGQEPYPVGAPSNRLVCAGDCSQMYGNRC